MLWFLCIVLYETWKTEGYEHCSLFCSFGVKREANGNFVWFFGGLERQSTRKNFMVGSWNCICWYYQYCPFKSFRSVLANIELTINVISSKYLCIQMQHGSNSKCLHIFLVSLYLEGIISQMYICHNDRVKSGKIPGKLHIMCDHCFYSCHRETCTFCTMLEKMTEDDSLVSENEGGWSTAITVGENVLLSLRIANSNRKPIIRLSTISQFQRRIKDFREWNEKVDPKTTRIGDQHK